MWATCSAFLENGARVPVRGRQRRDGVVGGCQDCPHGRLAKRVTQVFGGPSQRDAAGVTRASRSRKVAPPAFRGVVAEDGAGHVLLRDKVPGRVHGDEPLRVGWPQRSVRWVGSPRQRRRRRERHQRRRREHPGRGRSIHPTRTEEARVTSLHLAPRWARAAAPRSHSRRPRRRRRQRPVVCDSVTAPPLPRTATPATCVSDPP